mmetsp:Transcript_36509/g.105171  ORF Transcript_36509/g.105171 Transcript_36509/m.105171 type:complete len:263 (-) Transcript_36509:100-888(-)
MFCGACCKREQPVALVLPEQPTKSEAGNCEGAPLAAEPGGAGDPFLAGAEKPEARQSLEVTVTPPADRTPTPKEDATEDREPMEFTLILDRSDPSQPLGALFDASLPMELYVSAVLQGVEGLVQSAERASAACLKAGDFITAVNGVTGTEMTREVQTSRRLELSVRRPLEYAISIVKTGSLGCSISYDANTGTVLGIASVLEGPIRAWNIRAQSSGNTSEVVREGDRIIAVNGKRGYTSQLLEAIQSATDLKIVMTRPCPIH